MRNAVINVKFQTCLPEKFDISVSCSNFIFTQFDFAIRSIDLFMHFTHLFKIFWSEFQSHVWQKSAWHSLVSNFAITFNSGAVCALCYFSVYLLITMFTRTYTHVVYQSNKQLIEINRRNTWHFFLLLILLWFYFQSIKIYISNGKFSIFFFVMANERDSLESFNISIFQHKIYIINSKFFVFFLVLVNVSNWERPIRSYWSVYIKSRMCWIIKTNAIIHECKGTIFQWFQIFLFQFHVTSGNMNSCIFIDDAISTIFCFSLFCQFFLHRCH